MDTMKRLATPLLALLLAGADPARSAEPTAPAGWSLHRVSPAVCYVAGPQDGAAELSLMAEMGQFMLLINAPTLPRAKAEYPVILRLDGGQAIPLTGLGSDAAIGLAIGGPLAQAIVSAGTVEVTVGAQHFAFTPHDATAALDAAARCAGVPTLAERQSNAPTPIPGGGDWRLVTHLPGAPVNFCSARINGAEVDTMLMINNRGSMILIAGKPEWAAWGGEADITLAVDGAPPVALKANALGNLVLAEISDPALRHRIEAARTLDWRLPNGRFHAEVTGLGVALTALAACNHP
jgi:hypothetical protein